MLFSNVLTCHAYVNDAFNAIYGAEIVERARKNAGADFRNHDTALMLVTAAAYSAAGAAVCSHEATTHADA